MNNFREWLSDNLRYFELGAVIIIVLLALFFGLRAISQRFGDADQTKTVVENQKEESDEITEEKEETEPVEEDATENSAQEETQEEESQQPDARADVEALMLGYYNALGNRDIEGLRTLLDTLSDEDADAITNADVIEGYSDIECKVKDGLSDNSYAVFASFYVKYANYDTALPGVSCIYVKADDQGIVHVVSEPSDQEQVYLDQMIAQEEIQAIISEKQTEYDSLLSQDEALRGYLEQLEG